MSDEEIETAVDQVFLRIIGKTYREEDPPTDSLDKIMADFRAWFGEP